MAFTKASKLRWRREGGSSAQNSGRASPPWTNEENRRVLAHSIPDRQLAVEIGRSITAIHIRRHRLRQGEVAR